VAVRAYCAAASLLSRLPYDRFGIHRVRSIVRQLSYAGATFHARPHDDGRTASWSAGIRKQISGKTVGLARICGGRRLCFQAAPNLRHRATRRWHRHARRCLPVTGLLDVIGISRRALDSDCEVLTSARWHPRETCRSLRLSAWENSARQFIGQPRCSRAFAAGRRHVESRDLRRHLDAKPLVRHAFHADEWAQEISMAPQRAFATDAPPLQIENNFRVKTVALSLNRCILWALVVFFCGGGVAANSTGGTSMNTVLIASSQGAYYHAALAYRRRWWRHGVASSGGMGRWIMRRHGGACMLALGRRDACRRHGGGCVSRHGGVGVSAAAASRCASCCACALSLGFKTFAFRAASITRVLPSRFHHLSNRFAFVGVPSPTAYDSMRARCDAIWMDGDVCSDTL